MISDELNDIIEMLNNNGKMDFFEPATDEQIAKYEKINGIRFPTHYKECYFILMAVNVFYPLEFNFTVLLINR